MQMQRERVISSDSAEVELTDDNTMLKNLWELKDQNYATKSNNRAIDGDIAKLKKEKNELTSSQELDKKAENRLAVVKTKIAKLI